jgi:hypothetical protein
MYLLVVQPLDAMNVLQGVFFQEVFADGPLVQFY